MNQPHSYPGRFFSRRAATGEEVAIEVSPGGVTVRRRDGTGFSWPYAEMRVERKPAPGGPVTFERGSDPPEALVALDPRIVRAIHRMAPGEAHRFPAAGTLRRPLLLLGIAASAVLCLALLGITRGLPLLAELGARRVPVDWEERLGAATIESLAPAGRASDNAELVAAVDAIVARLAKAAPPNPYTFRVRVIEDDTMNAFAAPGGHIVVFTGLLRTTGTPEELAGVLAHEIQHVIQRHTTESLLRRASTGLLIAILAGDQGALGQVLKTAEGLGALSYSRRDEEEADREGVELLLAARVDPRGLARFLETMENEESGAGMPPTFLSTHPGTKQRLENLHRLIGEAAGPFEPIATATPWRELVARGPEEGP